MTQPFVEAKGYFSQDVELHSAVQQQQLLDGAASPLAWRIEWRPLVGRTLIAARDLPANEIVFRERPLVVAPSTRGGPYVLRGATPQVALALLNLPPNNNPARLLCTPPLQREASTAAASERVVSADAIRLNLERRLSRAHSLEDWVRDVMEALREREHKQAQLEQYEQIAPSDEASKLAKLLQQQDGANVDVSPPPSARTRGFTIPEVRWALGVAYLNAHGASRPTRGVIGVLASMMEHNCAPSCRVAFDDVASGSVVSLRTLRDVREGEALSISYVELEWPTAERRAVLELQYGFNCVCERCRHDDQGKEEEEDVVERAAAMMEAVDKVAAEMAAAEEEESEAAEEDSEVTEEKELLAAEESVAEVEQEKEDEAVISKTEPEVELEPFFPQLLLLQSRPNRNYSTATIMANEGPVSTTLP